MSAALARLRAHVLDALRDPNPILVRELRATFRTNLFIRFLYLVTAVVGIVVVAGGAISAAGPLAPGDVGELVFQIFFGTALFLTILIAPSYAATTLTGERASRTYESLILSGMAPERIVWGKFVAAFAAFTLVLVALAPVVGIAFLFGGISPWHVVVGYVGLFYALALAIAFGVAVSARMPSTAVAIVVTAPLCFGLAVFGTSTLAGLGELARDAWGTGMPGPFWFTDALVVRYAEWDTLALVVALPTYVVGMGTWFLLASSIAAVRPVAEDRSAGLKRWSLCMLPGAWFFAALFVALVTRSEERGIAGLVVAGFGMPAALGLALLFSDEPPLPPRIAAAPDSRWLSRIFGPGAPATLRFALVVVTLLVVGVAIGPGVVRHVLDPRFAHHARFDAGLVAIVVGNLVAALFVATIGAWLRITLRSGLASRVLTACLFVVAVVLPMIAQLVVAPDGFFRSDESVPLLVQLSPLCPFFVAGALAEGNLRADEAAVALAPLAVYVVAALGFAGLTGRRVAAIRAEQEARRARQVARAAELDRAWAQAAAPRADAGVQGGA
jgi:hypothetical protein